MTKSEIARQNGALSKGPVTEAGKAKSSQNALKHGGLSNRMFVLQNENPEAWQEFLALCVETFKPTTGFEQKLVEEIASAKWRLRRLLCVENATIDLKMDEQAASFNATFANQDEAARQAIAIETLTASGPLNHYSRYQTRLERSYERAVRSLREVRAAEAEITKRTNDPRTAL